jgi:hypothetical protein
MCPSSGLIAGGSALLGILEYAIPVGTRPRATQYSCLSATSFPTLHIAGSSSGSSLRQALFPLATCLFCVVTARGRYREEIRVKRSCGLFITG